jgi:hypothetical protein
MMQTEHRLPFGFETLEPFAESWAVAGTDNRRLRRIDSNEAERTAFYNAAKEQLGAAMEHLNGRPLNSLKDDEARLFNMMLTLAHIALAVEHIGSQEAAHSVSRRHFRYTSS